MLSTLSRLFLSALLMSFAWPLRGQFGHFAGALIPGACAAAACSLLIPYENWRRSFAQAVILGGIGFAFGGHFGYGKLLETITSSPDLKSAGFFLVEVFFIGALWGALGMTYLGFGLSEKRLGFREFGLLAVTGLFWWWALEIERLGAYIFQLYAGGLLLLFLYNHFSKKSRMVILFGSFGFFSFGIGFLAAALVLFFGMHDFFVGTWWTLRDQIWGFCGGLGLMLAAGQALHGKLEPAPAEAVWMQRLGFLFYTVWIPILMTWNVFVHWFFERPQATPILVPLLALVLCFGFLGILFFYFFRESPDLFSPKRLLRTTVHSTVFLMVYLSAQGILKTIVVFGIKAWETAFTLFILDTLLLSFAFYLMLTLEERRQARS